jgi:hypothetical protein
VAARPGRAAAAGCRLALSGAARPGQSRGPGHPRGAKLGVWVASNTMLCISVLSTCTRHSTAMATCDPSVLHRGRSRGSSAAPSPSPPTIRLGFSARVLNF